jgi:hypothetical protein
MANPIKINKNKINIIEKPINNIIPTIPATDAELLKIVKGFLANNKMKKKKKKTEKKWVPTHIHICPNLRRSNSKTYWRPSTKNIAIDLKL